MIIRKISLLNFRNFKNCKLEFSCDPNKNFTIILGQNTYGKTTLVKSFIWCLYKDNQFDDRVLLNSDVADAMTLGKTETVKVEIELEHKNYNYKITTKQNYTRVDSGNLSQGKPDTTVIKIDGSNSVPLNGEKADEEIESILRPELKEYFFFDGETNSIDNVSSKNNLTSAVSNIMGINRIETLRDYYDPNRIKSVIATLNSELIADNEFELIELIDKLDNAKNQLEKCKDDVEERQREIEKLYKQRTEKEDILNANKDIASLQGEKSKLKKEIVDAKDQKETEFDRLIKEINTSNSLLKVTFAKSFKVNDLEYLEEKSSFKSSNSYRGITEQAVNDLIKAGRCLCGTVIIDGNDACKHLMEAKEHMEPRDYGKYVSDFLSAEGANYYNAQSSLESIRKHAAEVIDAISSYEKNEKTLQNLIEKLEGRVDVGEIQSQLMDIYYQIGQNESILKNLRDADLPQKKSAIEDLNNKIYRITEKNTANDFIKRCIAYAKNIYTSAEATLTLSKEKIKLKLQEEVSKIFKSMYHGDRLIKIGEDLKPYTIVANKGKDKKVDGSTGLGTVMNYSFVTSLMILAKQSIADEEVRDPENGPSSYPLVMDAPFSSTDEQHIKNICHSLSENCDQILMFLMNKDFKYASDSISGRIGKKYTIYKISETEARIDEEEI